MGVEGGSFWDGRGPKQRREGVCYAAQSMLLLQRPPTAAARPARGPDGRQLQPNG